MRPSSLLRIKDLVVSLLLISSLLLPFGCALQQKNLREPSFYLALQTENIETEISRLEEVIQSGTDSPSRAEAFLNLALLYSHHKNPLPDYMRALEMIDEYALLDAEGAKANDVQYVAALLHEIRDNVIVFEELLYSIEIFKPKKFKEPLLFSILHTKDIEAKISRLENSIQSATDSSSRAEAFLNLALLYSHHRNPVPDYVRALSMIDEYALLDPEGAKASYVQYLAALLQEIGGINILRDVLQNRLEIFRDENRRLRKENEILREKYETLTIETQKTKEIIEKLKNLDIRLERKRRNIE